MRDGVAMEIRSTERGGAPVKRLWNTEDMQEAQQGKTVHCDGNIYIKIRLTAYRASRASSKSRPAFVMLLSLRPSALYLLSLTNPAMRGQHLQPLI